MTLDLVAQEKQHLAGLLEAIQRCVFFVDAANSSLTWPLDATSLYKQKKDVKLFGTLAAINERFAKLQDTLGAAMRHAMGLLSEPSETFLKVLAFYEKVGVIESIAIWQNSRTARNLAAHSYETDYPLIAEHFNLLHTMLPMLYRAASKFIGYCENTLQVVPARADFAEEFRAIVDRIKP